MAESTSFSKFVPGFDFLQGLVKTAGASLPNIGQWVAPTLNPEELEKRIEELRTVQFWLEQNARMLGATIQALEVQRMTLSTLKSMNVPLAQLSDALKIQVPAADANPMAAMAAFTAPPAAPPAAAAPAPASAPKKAKAAADSPAAPEMPSLASGVVDPMQWWGALSQQFAQLATNAMKDTATDAAKNLAGAMVKQSIDAAGETLRKAAVMPGAMAGSMVNQVVKTAAKKTAAKPAARAASKPASKRPAAKRSAR